MPTVLAVGGVDLHGSSCVHNTSICCSRWTRTPRSSASPARLSSSHGERFALLGLRALFFLVQGLLDRLVYLSTGLSIILAFIGVKLVLHWLHVDVSTAVPEIPTMVSLGVILGVLAVVVVASIIKTRHDPGAHAHRER